MARIVVTEFVSLDGVMEDPGGSEHSQHGAWTFKFNRGEEGNKFKMDETNNAQAQLLGRVTYEGFAAAWPQRSGDPFSDKFNSMPKYVISRTLKKADWNNSTILNGSVVEEVKNLKQRLKGDILVSGSAKLVQTLIKNDLIDQLNLMVFPVILGSGKRLFADTTEMKTLRLAESKPVGDGILILVYRPAEEK
ncbi:MAG TPA: dihydrofolate reductase family protein [Candidatus Dormibacteraeota bacterium]|nr:dihydrofolate reductase family protein [Candidatus Dormibacteraeota bacterium]